MFKAISQMAEQFYIDLVTIRTFAYYITICMFKAILAEQFYIDLANILHFRILHYYSHVWSNSFFYCRIQFCTVKTFTVSCRWYGNNPFWVTAAARAMPPPSTPARHSALRSSLASRQALLSPSAAAASPRCCSTVPQSDGAWGTGRKVLPCAFRFCDKAQGSGNCCLLWHLNVFALTWSRDP